MARGRLGFAWWRSTARFPHVTDISVWFPAARVSLDLCDRVRWNLDAVSCAGSNCAAGESASDVSLTPDGRFLYATNDFGNTVSPFAIGPDEP